MYRTMKLSMFMAAAMGLAACNGDVAGMNNNPAGPTTQNPAPSPNTSGSAPAPSYAGVYGVSGGLDFTKDGVFDGQIGSTLGALADLHDHPGKAVLTLLKASGGDVADTINDLPTFVRGILEGLLDTAIKNSVYKNNPSIDKIADVTQGIFQLTKTMVIHDEITVRKPNASNVAPIEQKLTGVTFSLLGKQEHVQFMSQDKVSMNGQINPRANAGADADLSIGTGTFNFPVGELVLKAAGPLLYSEFGAADMKGLLAQVIDCNSVGSELSSGTSDLVSPETGSQICSAGIALIGDQVERQLKAYKWDGVQVLGGRAKLVDVSQSRPQLDMQSDRITDGVWTWRFTVDGQSADVPSTFSGERIGAIQ